MIVDNFMFNNDKELLELRYHVLKDVVDYFVVSEANHTFAGKPKPFYAKKYVQELGLNADKFIFLETDVSDDKITIEPLDMRDAKEVNNPDSVKVYSRLRTQKDAIVKILDRFPDDTVFIHSDVDEIPKANIVKYHATVSLKHPDNIVKVPLVLLESSADKRVYNENNEPVPWNRALMFCTKRQLKTKGPAALRSEFENPFPPISITEDNKIVEDLGWHFTWMGSKENKLEKALSSAHSTAFSLIDNVSEETKKLLSNDLGQDFAKIINYHHKPYDLTELPQEIFKLPNVKKFLLPTLELAKPIKIVDYFMYFNEKELLELRYHMLKDYVDLFVVSESNVTFSGNSKQFSVESVIRELNLDINKFKIIQIDLSNLDNKNINQIDQIGSIIAKDTANMLSWTRERLQRDALLNVINDFDDDCVFIVSDIDEIIKPSVVSYVTRVCRENQYAIIKLPLVLLESRADKRMVNNNVFVPWDKSMFLATKKQLLTHTPNTIRAGLQRTYPITFITENNQRLEDLGWHFTWMGDENRLKQKAVNYGHAGNLDVVNTLSEGTKSTLEKSLDKQINLLTNYTLVDYPHNELPKEIFNNPRIKNFLLPNIVEKSKRIDNNLLLDYINSPLDFNANFRLGYNFECIGQTASAVSFYLRTAEKTSNPLVQYESLLRIANCFILQKNRNHTVTGLYNRAITVMPKRLEAYYLMAKFQLDIKDYQAAYLYSTLGLSLSLESNEKLMTDVNFPNKLAMEYVRAKSSWYVGFYVFAKQWMNELLANPDLDNNLRVLINNDLETVIKI